MPISKEEFVNLLNGDLGKEYSTLIQYVQHSGVVTGAAYMGVKDEFIEHAEEELEHAETLSDQIAYLGGTPTAATGPAARTSKDNIEMLQYDLELEEDAIRRYATRIKQAEELNHLDVAQKLREILAVEQEHLFDLNHALGR